MLITQVYFFKTGQKITKTWFKNVNHDLKSVKCKCRLFKSVLKCFKEQSW